MRASVTGRPRSRTVRLVAWAGAILLVALMLALAACGGDTTSVPTVGAPSHTLTLPLPTTTTVPTPATNPESRRYMTMLKETYDAANAVSRAMEERGASSTDPDAARLLGLRARAQAITARKAMVDRDANLADAATLQMRKLLMQAQIPAQSPVLEIVQKALASSEDIPAPSDSPEEAMAILETVIDDLSALVPAAGATDS